MTSRHTRNAAITFAALAFTAAAITPITLIAINSDPSRAANPLVKAQVDLAATLGSAHAVAAQTTVAAPGDSGDSHEGAESDSDSTAPGRIDSSEAVTLGDGPTYSFNASGTSCAAFTLRTEADGCVPAANASTDATAAVSEYSFDIPLPGTDGLVNLVRLDPDAGDLTANTTCDAESGNITATPPNGTVQVKSATGDYISFPVGTNTEIYVDGEGGLTISGAVATTVASDDTSAASQSILNLTITHSDPAAAGEETFPELEDLEPLPPAGDEGVLEEEGDIALIEVADEQSITLSSVLVRATCAIDDTPVLTQLAAAELPVADDLATTADECADAGDAELCALLSEMSDEGDLEGFDMIDGFEEEYDEFEDFGEFDDFGSGYDEYDESFDSGFDGGGGDFSDDAGSGGGESVGGGSGDDDLEDPDFGLGDDDDGRSNDSDDSEVDLCEDSAPASDDITDGALFDLVSDQGAVYLGCAKLLEVDSTWQCDGRAEGPFVAVRMEVHTSAEEGRLGIDKLDEESFAQALPDGDERFTSMVEPCEEDQQLAAESIEPSSSLTGWIVFEVKPDATELIFAPEHTEGWRFDFANPTSTTTPPPTTTTTTATTTTTDPSATESTTTTSESAAQAPADDTEPSASEDTSTSIP